MRLEPCDIPAVVRVWPTRHADERGWLEEVSGPDTLRELGIHGGFRQINRSISALPGTLRGLHFQLPPRAQGKLVQVLRGAILDVAVDLRGAEPTFGRHVAVRISEGEGQLWIPAGFAHGFCTLEPETEVLYLLTAPYSPRFERGIAWNDADLRIPWPVERPTLSSRDAANASFSDFLATAGGRRRGTRLGSG